LFQAAPSTASGAIQGFAMILLLSQFSFGLFVMAMLLTLASIFMILLILVQQGRGGGLTGALGGMGGQSAFGTKAGDLFTRITIVTAIIWILLSILTIAFFNRPLVSSEDAATDLGAPLSGGPAESPNDIGLPPSTSDQQADPLDLGDFPLLNPPTDAVPEDAKPADDDSSAAPPGEAAPPSPPSTDPAAPSKSGDDQEPQPADPAQAPPDNDSPSPSDGG
jgi:preprotein translocase subunit SecG